MKKYIILKGALISIFVLIIAGFITTSFLTEKVEASKYKAEMITNAFLLKTDAGQYEYAYDFMSQEVQNQISYEKFKETFVNSKLFFSDISEVELYNVRFMTNIGGPTTSNYNGIVRYEDGTTGRIEAVYIEEDGDLKIISIYIFPDNDRLKKIQY